MKSHKNKAYSEKDFYYASPLLELLSVEGSGVLCQSGKNDDFVDQGTVDWFTE